MAKFSPAAPVGAWGYQFTHAACAIGPNSAQNTWPKPAANAYPTGWLYRGEDWLNAWPLPPPGGTTYDPIGHIVTTRDAHACTASSNCDSVRFWIDKKTKQYHWAGSETSNAAVGAAPAPWASSATKFIDPYRFTNSFGTDWGIGGRVALGGLVDPGPNVLYGAWADLTLTYTLSRNQDQPETLLQIHIPDDRMGFELAYLPGVRFWRNEVELSGEQVANELVSCYGPGRSWNSPTDFGEDLQGAFYVDVTYPLAAQVTSATLDVDMEARAFDVIPEPGSLWLVALAGLSALWRRTAPMRC